MQSLSRIFSRADRFTTGIIISVILGLVIPCYGLGETFFQGLTTAAIVLLFFLYGVKLSRQSVIDGLLNWRLQSMVLFFTFVFFPIVIPLCRPVFEPMTGAALFMGLVYVACLPSTVQSSIAFTSVAGGNVPAAVCSASVSSLLGVLLTPLLVSLLFSTDGSGAEVGLDTVLKICYQILLPFTLGQLCQKHLRPLTQKHSGLIKWNDQITIWLVIYTSFSNATSNGYWGQLGFLPLIGLIVACTIIIVATLIISFYTSKWLGFNREDRIAIVFCGSKKSLAVGAPMMLATFGALDNNLLLPLMIFHQVQLMICARLAAQWQLPDGDDGGY